VPAEGQQLGVDVGRCSRGSGAIPESGTRICDRATASAEAARPRRSGACSPRVWTTDSRCISPACDLRRQHGPPATFRAADRLRGRRTCSLTAGKRIALLSLAFTAHTDGVRSSPALSLAARLLDEGADLRADDPAARENARRVLPDRAVVPTVEEALRGADAAVIAIDWPVYRDLDWATLHETMRRPLIIDGRRLLPYAQLRSMGYQEGRIGDGVNLLELPAEMRER
jgi:hypothetical protein